MKKKHKIALFIVYIIIFEVAIAMIDYYAYLTLPGIWLISLAVILAAIATKLHLKYKTKTKADEFAKEIEEIL